MARSKDEGHLTDPATPDATLVQEEGYRFAVRFRPGLPVLYTDEDPPVGGGTGPTPVQLLCAAVGNCLAASLVFALSKFRQPAGPVRAEVKASVGRNEENRLRVQAMKVDLKLAAPAASLEHLDRVLGQFEAFCTVTQSVRAAFPVHVAVYDAEGARLK